MLYLNQLDYPHVRYEHNVEHGGVPIERQKVSTSGCGLCSVCMVVDHLTTHHLSIEDCVQLSYEAKANIIVGTRMCFLGPLAAEKFGMDFRASSDINEVLAHLQAGGEVVINVGGSHDDYVGLYSKGGHYIVAIAYDGKELCILDPSYKENKYEIEPHKGKIRVDYPFTYCDPQVIMDDTQNRETPFYLFSRKKPQ